MISQTCLLGSKPAGSDTFGFWFRKVNWLQRFAPLNNSSGLLFAVYEPIQTSRELSCISFTYIQFPLPLSFFCFFLSILPVSLWVPAFPPVSFYPAWRCISALGTSSPNPSSGSQRKQPCEACHVGVSLELDLRENRPIKFRTIKSNQNFDLDYLLIQRPMGRTQAMGTLSFQTPGVSDHRWEILPRAREDQNPVNLAEHLIRR